MGLEMPRSRTLVVGEGDSLLCSDGSLWVKGFRSCEGCPEIKDERRDYDRNEPDPKMTWVNIEPALRAAKIQLISVYGCFLFTNSSCFKLIGCEFPEQRDAHRASDWIQVEGCSLLLEWKYSKDFTSFRSWHGSSGLLFFTTEAGVHQLNFFSLRGKEFQPHELIFPGRSIMRIHGRSVDPLRLLCLLDDGSLWLLDEEGEYGVIGQWPKGLKGFQFAELSFFRGKHVEHICCGSSYFYVLASGTLYGFGDRAELCDEKPDDDDNSDESNLPEGTITSKPSIDTFFKDKSIIKLVGGIEIVMVWCQEGLFLVHMDNGATPYAGALITNNPDGFLPFKFFQDKEIEDIAIPDESCMLVKCTDAIYTMSDYSCECCPIELDDSTVYEPQRHPLSDYTPLLFESLASKKQIKSALSTDSPNPKRT